MSRVIIGWSMVLFTMLVPVIKVASAVVESSTGAAAWGVSSDSATDRCSLLAVND
jgi:hypothetical protein